MTRLLLPVLVLGLGLLPLAGAARADDDAGSAPATYTPEEEAALDRALHAGNLTREDLRFRKDLAQGHAALPVVKALLEDPLRIAPEVDALARAVGTPIDGALAPAAALRAALARLRPDAPVLVTPPRDPPAPPADPEAMAVLLAGRLATNLEAPFLLLDEAGPAVAALRRELPKQMAWHDVFASPFPAEEDAAIDAFLEGRDESWLHARMALVPLDVLVAAWIQVLGDLPELARSMPQEAFPTEAPYALDTGHGRIGIGTFGDDVWEGDYAAILDPGGNDRYVGRIAAPDGLPGRRVAFVVDLDGDDEYACGDADITLGAAVLGIAALFDLGQGNDRYAGGHASLGAAAGGVAVLYDDGGSDVYEGKTFTQGAAGFGVGLLMDDAVQAPPALTSDEGTKDPVTIAEFDNDRLHAWANAQAFARCQGVAMCVNRRGNEIYEAGGVYLHAPLFADRYQSFSQGFAIGERGIDYAGGIAFLADLDGNDRYLGDIYDQGVGYWYGAGLLFDGGGNDVYEMTQYGQGSGIHLAVGGLVDAGGNDTYVMHSGLGQGGSHDYAVSVLHDRGGNDRYMGSTSCNGCGLTNAVGIQIDRSGDDTYGARREGGVNTGRPARGFPSIGLLVDLGGHDDYLGVMQDGGTWRHTDMGLGVDVAPPEPAEGTAPAPSGPDRVAGTAEVPAVCAYEGELTEAVFDELWALAIRWEVGDNRRIVPEARKRLVAFGAAVLPHLDRAMEKGASGLEMRAFTDVLKGLIEGGAEEGVLDLLRRNLAAPGTQRPTVALVVIGDLALNALEEDVAKVLASEDAGLARRAAGVLRRLGSRAGRERLQAWLSGGDELQQAAALDALLGTGGAEEYAVARPLLAHPHLSVRGRMVGLLVERWEALGPSVVRDVLEPGDLGSRAVRSLLDVLARAKPAPDDALFEAVAGRLDDADWAMRADAARPARVDRPRSDAGRPPHARGRAPRRPPRRGDRSLRALQRAGTLTNARISPCG